MRCDKTFERRAEAKDFLIESDIIIDFLKGVKGARLALEKAADEGVVRISAVSAAQVMAASKEAAREATSGLLDSFGIVPVDKEVALLAGLLLSASAGDRLELDDCIVAAACHELGAVLVTRGHRKYPRPDIEMRIETYR